MHWGELKFVFEIAECEKKSRRAGVNSDNAIVQK